MTMPESQDIQDYLQSCRTEFWREVFRVELDYLSRHLEGCRDVLSVGCGPAIIESGLSERGFRVAGLDVSQEAWACVPDRVRTVAMRAEDMHFEETRFDAVIYVASLQFVDDYEKALARTAGVLRQPGRLIVMLLNPQSAFFKEKVGDPASYFRKIKHTSLAEIEQLIALHSHIRTEYFMGVRNGTVFESQDPDIAVLYIVSGTMKPDNLIHGYDFELVEPACHPGADKWSARARVQNDIAVALPYLNATLKGAHYDHASQVLIWVDGGRKHAFRPYEIAVAPVVDREEGRQRIDELVSVVNRTWTRRHELAPDYQRRELPSVMHIYRLLPKTNCGECGYLTCMRYAVGLRQGESQLSQCSCLSEENRRKLLGLLEQSQ